MGNVGNFLLVTIPLLLAILGILSCSANAQETGGLGCDAVLASYSQNPIPETDLRTGTFYQIQSKYPKLPGGFVSWASKRDATGAMLVFSDYNNLEMYQKGGGWHKDTFWAFLTTEIRGWYRIINCGFPHKYLTWSVNTTLSASADRNGFPLVIDEHYLGRHARQDFLFKPAYLKKAQAYQLITKSLNFGIVSESSSSYSGESYFLKVEATSKSTPSTKSIFSIDTPLNEPLLDNGTHMNLIPLSPGMNKLDI